MIILISITFVALFCWATFGLASTAERVHGELDKFMAEAKATKDIQTLWSINKRLVAYAKEQCLHKHFGSHAKEVNVYICAKIEGIKSCSPSN